MLNDVYLDNPTDNAARYAYFAVAAKRVSTQLCRAKGDSQAMIKGMAKAVDENRILISSTRKAEQGVIGTTRVAGVLTRDDGATPHLGVYFNDATETKLEYYRPARNVGSGHEVHA